jgi:DNA-binding response OmpR family regulator
MAPKRNTVLVVEDDSSMRLLCRVNLELEGFDVLEAPTLDDARRMLASGTVDFVVLDVHVGAESGYDLIDTIRSEYPAPIALITGSAEITQQDRERVDAVLPKPFELADLTAAIHRLVAAPAER